MGMPFVDNHTYLVSTCLHSPMLLIEAELAASSVHDEGMLSRKHEMEAAMKRARYLSSSLKQAIQRM